MYVCTVCMYALTLTVHVYVCAAGDSSLSSPDSKASVDHYSAFFNCAEQIETFASEDASRRYGHTHTYMCMSVCKSLLKLL